MGVTKDIADLLVSANLGIFAGTSGWSIYIAKEPSTPNSTITIYGTGGYEANAKFALDRPVIQVRVRGDVDGYVAAENKIIAIKNFLLGSGPTTINGNKVIGIWAEGDYGFLQYDTLNRPIFYLNCRTYYQPSATGNRVPLG